MYIIIDINYNFLKMAPCVAASHSSVEYLKGTSGLIDKRGSAVFVFSVANNKHIYIKNINTSQAVSLLCCHHVLVISLRSSGASDSTS